MPNDRRDAIWGVQYPPTKTLRRGTVSGYPYRTVIWMLLMFLAACQGKSEDPAVPTDLTATPAPFGTQVRINTPQDSTIVYAETLHITGTVTDSSQRFKLQLVDIDDQVITETIVDAQPGNWQVELVHGYTGDPSEIIIRAVPEDNAAQPYDTVSILLSDISHRPNGIFGSITYPANGVEIGGDMLLIEGRASGAPENAITIELVGESVIDSKTITLDNPNFVDDVPWQVELATNGYTGQATIQAYYISPADGSRVVLDSVIVTVLTAAG